MTKNIKCVEEAVKEISMTIACLLADPSKWSSHNLVSKKDLEHIQSKILLIENNMHDLIHLYDLLDLREKSDYFIGDMDKLVRLADIKGGI